MVPAKGEFLLIYEAIIIFVEHLEDVTRPLLRQRVNVAFVVAEQSFADEAELVEIQMSVTGWKGSK